MIKNDDLNFEEKGDYSMELLNEIWSDIINLSKYSPSQVEKSLQDINSKIDLARTYWLNVEDLDNQVRDFRVILFNRDIDNKLQELEWDFNSIYLDITRIEKDYCKLILEKGIDIESLNIKMKKLRSKVTTSKIKLMINNINNWSAWNWEPDFDKIAEEIAIAEKEWINVDEIKDMIYC